MANGRLAAFVLVAAGVSACQSAPADDAARGQQLFAYCTPCHGADGTGNQRIGAPAIAGLPQWYVQRQLHNFRDGVRGTHPDDVEGMKMRPMALALADAKDVERVAHYVSTLKQEKRPATIAGGNAQAGQAAFAPCMACHGPNGGGNVALNAPPIAFNDDWYNLRQYQKFQHGLRGVNPRDTFGAQMRPMSMLVTNEQTQKDLFTYIGTLSGQAQ